MLASSSTSLRLKGDEKALFRTEQKIVKNKCVVCPWLLIVYEVMKKKNCLVNMRIIFSEEGREWKSYGQLHGDNLIRCGESEEENLSNDIIFC